MKPASEHLPGDASPSPGEEGSQTTVTTTPRKAMKLPEGIAITVTQQNMRDYVGP